jgi:hypothetical protein
VNLRQDIIVEDAAGLLVNDLALDKVLALQNKETTGHFGTRLSVHQPFAAGPGNFYLFLGVEASIFLFSQ